jgi:hypothetical protein
MMIAFDYHFDGRAVPTETTKDTKGLDYHFDGRAITAALTSAVTAFPPRMARQFRLGPKLVRY